MIKRILVIFILIYLIIIPSSYSTDEIISSQMEALNLSSFMTEGKKYTEDVFRSEERRVGKECTG